MVVAIRTWMTQVCVCVNVNVMWNSWIHECVLVLMQLKLNDTHHIWHIIARFWIKTWKISLVHVPHTLRLADTLCCGSTCEHFTSIWYRQTNYTAYCLVMVGYIKYRIPGGTIVRETHSHGYTELIKDSTFNLKHVKRSCTTVYSQNVFLNNHLGDF